MHYMKFVNASFVQCGCRSWIDASFQGQGRRTQVNKVLGSICKYLWPGVVMEKGVEVPCMSWDQYGLAFNAEHRNAQGAVWHEFWVCSLAQLELIQLYNVLKILFLVFFRNVTSCLKMEV
jgi:hypothetical protein